MLKGLRDLLRRDTKDTEQSSTNAAAQAGEQTEQTEEETSMAATSGKRAREIETSIDGARGSKKVRQSGSEKEDNLTANYGKHPEAKPISFPGAAYGSSTAYSFNRDWGGKEASPPKKMAPGPRRGVGVRPQNTLGNGAPQAAKKGTTMFSNYASNHPRTGRSSQPNGRTELTHARNGVAPSSSTIELQEDSIVDDDLQLQTSSRKRRKIGDGDSTSTVDLTAVEEGASFATASEKGDRRGSGGSQTSISKKSRNKLPWQGTEQRAVDSLVNVNAGNVKNILSNVNVRTPVVPSSRPTDTKKNIINVDVDGSATSNVTAAVRISPRAKKADATKMQPINLTEGYEEVTERARQRRTAQMPQQQPYKDPRAYGDADIKGVNDLMSSAASRKPKPAKSSQQAPSAQMSREQSHETNDETCDSHVRRSASRSVALDSTSLRKKFVRDNMVAPITERRKAIQRMQTSSQTDQSMNDDSLDELGGPTTIGTSASRQNSPAKPFPAPSQADRRSPSRQISPSNIKPTNLKELNAGGLQLPNKFRPHTSDVESLRDDTDGEVRVSIRAICCKAICSHVRGLELVWDDSMNAFSLFSQKQRQRSPGTKKPITISQGEVTLWFQSKDRTWVYLKVPASEVSNGGILMDFHNDSALSDCFNMLVSDRLTIKTLSPITMDKLIEKQKEEQLEVHRRETSKAVMNPVVSNQKLLRNPRLQHQRQEDEEQIVYETDSPASNLPPQRPRARERMQNGDAETLAQTIVNDGHQSARRTHQNETMSVFFSNGGVRRSTRQTKPSEYEDRAPSPVKWTKVNNPEPWAHPVLYPSEGPKRVTVEFNDLERLDEEEWLNDNLVNYELKHIEHGMTTEDRDKVHFFNTFFFTSVSTNGSRRAFNYDAVKRWTKNIDIFTIPYLVVPISENLHWFVIVICNLHNLPRKFAEREEEETIVSAGATDSEFATTRNGTPLPGKNDFDARQAPETVADNEAGSPASEAHEGHDNGKAIGEDDVTDDTTAAPGGDTFEFDDDGKIVEQDLPQSIRPGTATSKKSRKKAPAPRTYDPDQPLLIALDSFGHPRSGEMKILKRWIAAEAKAKRSMDVDWKSLQGMNAKDLPAQLNFSDCGVFLAGYIHAFAKDPQKFVTKAMLKEFAREDMFADFDPIKRRNDMRERLLQLHKEQEQERVARKKAKAAARNGVVQQAPKVADASELEAAKAQSPAVNSSPAPAQSAISTSSPAQPRSSAPRSRSASPPNSDHENSTTTTANMATQIQQEMSSATAAGEDDLEYSQPRALGEKADRDEPSDPLYSSNQNPVDDDGDSEMLDVADRPEIEEEREGGLFRFPPGFTCGPPSADIFTQPLPVVPAETSMNSDNLLNDLLRMKDLESEQRCGAKVIINLEADDEQPSQQLEPVIPDSQEKENQPVADEKEDEDNTLGF
ncbi:hypothetical protein DOTSEDRAFT_72752 [Dothistroma septosporum NZE10]|uniref:Ubiquitin-like protease family profile domain-containing protein n=1 Tax=Dothistroma septosporum (strain NZE10 / CBS 128990) TaxID=675120 RepID=M2XM07_DOTSN|nr:hypothetical protein DOTSEDRAFT_72752 [Dothistroma septosporum NZE10]